MNYNPQQPIEPDGESDIFAGPVIMVLTGIMFVVIVGVAIMLTR